MSNAFRGRSEQPRSNLDTMKSSTSLSRTASSSLALREDEISVTIKCPSLDKDSALVRVRLSETVLALKQTIEATWPGGPRAGGMRCIRSGRILSDTEVFSQLIQTLEEGETLSLHLVIRPDAWSDPQNRPTPSRRSSYLRQQQQLQQSQHQHSLPRSALATQVTPQDPTDDDVPPRPSATSTQAPSSFQPSFVPYFSEPSLTAARSTPAGPTTADETFASVSNSNASMNFSPTPTSQYGDDTYAVFEDTLRVTAPENWPLLIEALKAAYDEYVLIYERIYNEAHAAQKGSESASATPVHSPSTQSDLLTSVETTLLGWDPIQVPGQDHASAGSAASPSTRGDTQHLYQQVSHRGLPYLLRISTNSLAVQRSEALSTLLQRITTLGTMIEKLENVIMLGRLIQVQRPASSSSHGAEPASTQLNGAATAVRTMALEQGGLMASVNRIAQRTAEACRGITFADARAVIVPMAFVWLKVGILLSIVLRRADTIKMYFVLGLASIYVVFESYRIVQRRMRVRQRMAPRAPAPPLQPPPQAPQQGAGQAAAGNNAGQADGVGQADAAPMGANVPTAPSHEEQVERQATQEPLRPLPPPQAPPRFASRTRFSYDWCIDQMAFIGLNAEDAELGLLPAPGTPAAAANPTSSGWMHRILTSEWILPPLLLVFTMMPAVEQRRKRAIEERERVIRKWTRLEQERRQRVQEMLRELEEKQKLAEQSTSGEESGFTSTPAPMMEVSAGEDLELQQKRAEYADRMLRQRRTTEAVDMNEDDLVARQVARQMQEEEEEEEVEDMNMF